MITLRNIQNTPAFVILAVLAFMAISVAVGCAGHDMESSLIRTTSDEKSPNADGFVQHWLILEPFNCHSGLLFRSSACTRKPIVCIKKPQPVTNKQKAPTNTSMYMGTNVNCAPVRLEAFNFIARITS